MKTPETWKFDGTGLFIITEKGNPPRCIACSPSPRPWRKEDAILMKSAPKLLAILIRMTEKVERANAIQHSGGKICAADWSELYMLANEARSIIGEAT